MSISGPGCFTSEYGRQNGHGLTWRVIEAGPRVRRRLVISTAVILLASVHGAAADGNLVTGAAPARQAIDWSGFYLGGHLGYAWGNSDWTASPTGGPEPRVSGSFSLAQPIDTFSETGSFFEGLQAGYDYMLPSRFVVGAEADISFPSFPNLDGISIGGTSTLSSPLLGAETFSENVVSFGSVRGRIGYAPNDWLFYLTGGFAWTYDQLTLTPLSGGSTESPFLSRFGWSAGAGLEVPVAPHWTAGLEYLFTDYPFSNVTFPAAAQRFSSDLSLQEVRANLNYRFGATAENAAAAPAMPDLGNLSFHGQSTFVWQAYPAIRSPFEGPNSLPGGGEGRETWDLTLFAGMRLWR